MVGVSSDKPAASKRFAEELDLPFPLVPDPGAVIIKAYDVKWPLVKIAARVTYIIDQNRKIAGAHKSARDIKSHVQLACSFAPEN